MNICKETCFPKAIVKDFQVGRLRSKNADSESAYPQMDGLVHFLVMHLFNLWILVFSDHFHEHDV